MSPGDQERQSLSTASSSPARVRPQSGHSRHRIKPVTAHEFDLLRRLIYREAGIFLPEGKKALLERRLARRVQALGLRSFGAYYRVVSSDSGLAERVSMLDLIATNETRFFREPSQFEFLQKTLVPTWREAADEGRRHRRLRVWSAACSTGEEPFSLAMVLRHHLPATAGWDVEILATDLSASALARAKAAVWPIEAIRDIPERFVKKFMLRGKRSQLGKIRASRELRSIIRFERLNLHNQNYSIDGVFDLILCRNVLIYFDARSKLGVLDRLLRVLAPDGYLFVGHAESLTDLSLRVKAVQPNIYRFSGASAKGRG